MNAAKHLNTAISSDALTLSDLINQPIELRVIPRHQSLEHVRIGPPLSRTDRLEMLHDWSGTFHVDLESGKAEAASEITF